MEHKDFNMIGLDEESQKIRGTAEFSFEDKEQPALPSILTEIVPKKRIINQSIVKHGRNTKSGKKSELF